MPEREEGTTDAPLEERPATDKLSRAVARSRIAGALFAKHEPVRLGRYQLLERVGAGAMGVVWGAWDPELDRRVAIKLVRTTIASARERIVREGQALAKLSHPNVVPIYDVGVVDEQVYLVMEWVRGKNLRVWAETPRSAREVASVYRAAASGLATAHAAGLIHRDFKPDNAMVGEDGRVRVLDFGLARGHDEASDGARAGTPMYMAPEQAQGEAVPASDQYALGVSLREALGDAPPRWLAEIVARATAVDPAQRFASMDELVGALGRDPARVWRQRIVAAGVIGVAGAAFAIGTLRAGNEIERCSGGGAELAAVWNLGVRGGIGARLRGLGPYGAQIAASLETELATYSERWVGAKRGTCLAHDIGELPTVLYTANLSCLGRARSALGAATEVLASATTRSLPDAVAAARGLPDPEGCRLDVQASTIAPPPAIMASRVDALDASIARARVLAVASDPRAIGAAEATARDAHQLGYRPLVGRAELVHGIALLFQQRRKDAIPVLDTATAVAFEVGDGDVAVEALARSLYAIATIGKGASGIEEAVASLKLAEPIARGLVGPSGAFARALLFNNAGTLRLSRQDPDGAREWFGKALRGRPHEPNVELASISGNLALVEQDRARRDALFDSAGDELTSAVGADHPMTLDVRVNAGVFAQHPGRASELLRDACGRFRRLHPHLVERITQCAYELAWLAEERGDAHELADALDAVTAEGKAETAIAVGYRLLLAGKNAEAAREMTTLADSFAAMPGMWARWRGIDALILVAIAEHRLGDRVRETQILDRALDAISGLSGLSAATFYQRRLARLHALRARLDGAIGAHVTAATQWYRAAGGYESLVAELEKLATDSR